MSLRIFAEAIDAFFVDEAVVHRPGAGGPKIVDSGGHVYLDFEA